MRDGHDISCPYKTNSTDNEKGARLKSEAAATESTAKAPIENWRSQERQISLVAGARSTSGQARTANSGSKLPHSTWQRLVSRPVSVPGTACRAPGTAEACSAAKEPTPLSNQRLLDLCQGVADFLDVRDHRDVIIFEPGDIALAVDDSDGATGDALIGKIDAKLVGYRAAS
jgi:hypothetical protein